MEFFLLQSPSFWRPDAEFVSHLDHELTLVGLDQSVLKKNLGDLSGGQTQRLLIALFRVLRRMLNVGVRKKMLVSNPCAGVEFPVRVKGLFRPHYVTWSEQKTIEGQSPQYLRNVIRIITETGLRVYKELAPIKKEDVDLDNAIVWIADSKTATGVAEVPLTELAVEAFRSQISVAGPAQFLFPNPDNPSGYQASFKKVWATTLRKACVPYFRIYDLRSTYATRLSAGGVADEWVTQLLRQGDAKVFKKYSQMKLQMKREALENCAKPPSRGLSCVRTPLVVGLTVQHIWGQNGGV